MSELTPTGNNYISVQSLWARARCVWWQLGIWHMEMELEAIEQEHDRLEEDRAAPFSRVPCFEPSCALSRTYLV